MRAVNLACISLILVTVSILGAQNRYDPLRQFRTSNDITWLEKVASDETIAQYVVGFGHSPKGVRTRAYVRLGEIGSPEAIQAIHRIEESSRKEIPAEDRFSMGLRIHPGAHMGDSVVKPVAQAEMNGTTYAIVMGCGMGDLDMCLTHTQTPSDVKSWTRPKLIPNRFWIRISDAKLRASSPDTLLFTFTQESAGSPGSIMEVPRQRPAPPKVGPQEWKLSIKDIERDSDGDGWTDVEEQRLGLDPHNADSDHDGIPDGRDVCPDYAPSANDNDEDAQILERSFFAQFGLTGARHVMLVDSKSRRLQMWGYRGPVLYIPEMEKWRAEHQFGMVYVTWKIKSKTAIEATVELSDFEADLAAGGYEVKLRKISNEWIVVSAGMSWIS